jgi:hypothetical protein
MRSQPDLHRSHASAGLLLLTKTKGGVEDATLGVSPSDGQQARLVVMIDICDAATMVTRLREAERQFEKGAPVPHAASELLDELLDALADSGPLELHVTPEAWLGSIRSAERGIAAADDGSSPKSVRRAKRSIRELKRLFGARDSAREVLLLLPLVLLAILMLPLVLAVMLIERLTRRYVPDARKVATELGLPDRLLFAHAVKAARSEVKSTARARSGAYVHPVLVATDRRLVLAQSPIEVPVGSGQQRFAVGWEIPYCRIRSFATETIFRGDDEREVVTIQAAEREIIYKMPNGAGKALAAILSRRAPEAVNGPVAPSARVAITAT